MRREYHKPFLAVESFQLSAAIAASCTGNGGVALNHDIGSCWENTSNGVFYNAALCDVDLTPPDDDGGDSLCYHGPDWTNGVTFIYS